MKHPYLPTPPRPSYDRTRAEETRRLKRFLAARAQARLAESRKLRARGGVLLFVDFLIKLFVTTCVSLTVGVMLLVVFYKYSGG